MCLSEINRYMEKLINFLLLIGIVFIVYFNSGSAQINPKILRSKNYGVMNTIMLLPVFSVLRIISIVLSEREVIMQEVRMVL